MEHIPEDIEPGVLYVSMHYGTAAHSCCCGCGEEVVTPITPTDWRMTFDGETISLWPSVGNWDLPCRSHYVITRNRVIEAGPWTRKQIERGRRRDRLAKADFYGTDERYPDIEVSPGGASARLAAAGFLRRIWRWVSRWGRYGSGN